MAEIVNLRRHRKKLARDIRETEAAENRARFGLPAAERRAEKARAERAMRDFEGHRRVTPDGADDPSA